jgi:hypothetical protein
MFSVFSSRTNTTKSQIIVILQNIIASLNIQLKIITDRYYFELDNANMINKEKYLLQKRLIKIIEENDILKEENAKLKKEIAENKDKI